MPANFSDDELKNFAQVLRKVSEAVQELTRFEARITGFEDPLAHHPISQANDEDDVPTPIAPSTAPIQESGVSIGTVGDDASLDSSQIEAALSEETVMAATEIPDAAVEMIPDEQVQPFTIDVPVVGPPALIPTEPDIAQDTVPETVLTPSVPVPMSEPSELPGSEVAIAEQHIVADPAPLAIDRPHVPLDDTPMTPSLPDAFAIPDVDISLIDRPDPEDEVQSGLITYMRERDDLVTQTFEQMTFLMEDSIAKHAYTLQKLYQLELAFERRRY